MSEAGKESYICMCTVEPLNIESIGTANFSHYLEVFFIERYKSIEVYANGEKFNYERFSLLGEFIIGGSSVATYIPVEGKVCPVLVGGAPWDGRGGRGRRWETRWAWSLPPPQDWEVVI